MRIAVLPLLAVAGCGATSITVARRASAGAVASMAPPFRLPAHRGGEIDTASLRGQRVALVFYRGFW